MSSVFRSDFLFWKKIFFFYICCKQILFICISCPYKCRLWHFFMPVFTVFFWIWWYICSCFLVHILAGCAKMLICNRNNKGIFKVSFFFLFLSLSIHFSYLLFGYLCCCCSFWSGIYVRVLCVLCGSFILKCGKFEHCFRCTCIPHIPPSQSISDDHFSKAGRFFFFPKILLNVPCVCVTNAYECMCIALLWICVVCWGNDNVNIWVPWVMIWSLSWDRKKKKKKTSYLCNC